MSWRPRHSVAAFAALALLTIAALAPLASADHAYSHRYIVWGRVIDAENNPVPGLTVDLGYEKPFTPEGPCANQPGTETEAFGPTRTTPVTNQLGEFVFCFHTHGMSRGTPGVGIVRIETLGFEHRFDFDGFNRHSFVPIKLTTVQPTANKTALNELYTVQGRGWEGESKEIKVEGVGVYGDTLHGKPYTITTMFTGEEPQTFTGETNNYGDFAVRVPVDARPTGGKVNVTVEGYAPKEYDVDPVFGTTYAAYEFGERHMTPGASLLAILGLVAVVALFARRR